ncbi:unnamed protein product [Cuscuta campestris]|uniref:DUF6598 domain-containing protein n=1 Tax=Cuscuta campestris TaxID=132261 RepID=A0A484K3X4_9ASTE|nr:unnamed protein product [Cuscuta campestris]
MVIDADTLMQKYPNVSQEEIDKFRTIAYYPAFSEFRFEHRVAELHRMREEEKKHGKQAFLVGPLVQLISVQFLPAVDNLDRNQSFTIYGQIYAEFPDTTSENWIVQDFYNRKSSDAQVLEKDGFLTLITPDCSRWPFNAHMEHARLVVDVYAGDENICAQFGCADDVNDQEHLKWKRIHRGFGSLVLCYSVIPFAIYGRVKVCFIRKQGCTQNVDNHFLKVNGKVVARSCNSFDGYTLFDKKPNEFEEVETSNRGKLNMSRSWVGLSANTSLIIDIHLSEYGTEHEILRKSLDVQIRNDVPCGDDFIIGDICINVSVLWYSPNQGRCFKENSGMLLDSVSSSHELSSQETSKEEDDGDDEMSEFGDTEGPSNISRCWKLCPHLDIPLPSSALQIFSVFIGREKLKALQIYGSIKVLSPPCSYYIFNKEASGAFGLEEGYKTIPVLHGPGVRDDCRTVKMKFDLKDRSSPLYIRGRLKLHWSLFTNSPTWNEKLLCSVVQGEHGFAAVHYALFSEAVQANVQVFCKSKNENVDFSPKVFGSLVAHYSIYDYTSRYNKDFFRIVLFERDQRDPAQVVGTEGVISLARPSLVVPMGSTLIVAANLFGGVSNQGFKEFRIGSSSPLVMEGENYNIYVHVKWWGDVSV